MKVTKVGAAGGPDDTAVPREHERTALVGELGEAEGGGYDGDAEVGDA